MPLSNSHIPSPPLSPRLSLYTTASPFPTTPNLLTSPALDLYRVSCLSYLSSCSVCHDHLNVCRRGAPAQPTGAEADARRRCCCASAARPSLCRRRPCRIALTLDRHHSAALPTPTAHPLFRHAQPREKIDADVIRALDLLLTACAPPPPPQDEEVRLYSTPQERELFDSLSTLYSIIVSFEYLERAYVRDSIGAKE